MRFLSPNEIYVTNISICYFIVNTIGISFVIGLLSVRYKFVIGWAYCFGCSGIRYGRSVWYRHSRTRTRSEDIARGRLVRSEA